MTDMPVDRLIQKEKLATIDLLSASIAHEINNPVNYISLSSASLKKDLADIVNVLKMYEEITPGHGVKKKLKEIEAFKAEVDLSYVLAEVNQLIDSIAAGADRIAMLVKDLRVFSHSDYKTISEININSRIDLVLIILSSRYKFGVNVVKDFGALPPVEAVLGKLDQVFMNILTNAMQAIKYKGEVYITTRLSEDTKTVTVSIRDTGVGIEDSTKEKMFEPYFTTKSTEEGTGLGLAISMDIINQHKGSIECRSKVGEGAEFIITIPVKWAG